MPKQETGMNFNTFLLACVLAVMGWVGYEAAQSGKAIAGLQVMQAVQMDAIKSLDAKFNSAVPRLEYTEKILALEAHLRLIDVEIEKLKHP